MGEQAVLSVERGAFSTMQEALADITRQGLWPTTYISTPTPELPVHWHDCNIQGYLVKGDTYLLDENNERVEMSAGDKLILPEGSLHAEGTITEEVVYIVGLEDLRPYQHALQLLDPKTYPNPALLSLDPDFAAELFGALQAAAPPPPPIG